MEFIPHAIMHLCWCCARCNIRLLPPFQPNEYLFEKHADKGEERWEIYAWAVRDAMIKAGGFKPIDLPLKVKMQYERHLWGLPGVAVPDTSHIFEKSHLLMSGSGSTDSKEHKYENASYLLSEEQSPTLESPLEPALLTDASQDENQGEKKLIK
jgi:hypothetical protein